MRSWHKEFLLAIGLTMALAALFGRTYLLTHNPDSSLITPSGSQPVQRNTEIITVHYHERTPYYNTGADGVFGVCADPVNIAFRRAGVPFRWQRTPAKRQLDIIRQDKGMDCALGWFKNPERELFGRFSLPVYQDRPTVALARADNDRIVSGAPLEATLSDRDLVLLRKDGYSYGEFIDQKIAMLQPKEVITTGDNLSMLNMVHRYRADYFFIAQEEARALLASSQIQASDFKLVTFSDMPEGNKRYLICSKLVSEELMERIDRAIQGYLIEEKRIVQP